jgi:hypothetical protein
MNTEQPPNELFNEPGGQLQLSYLTPAIWLLFAVGIYLGAYYALVTPELVEDDGPFRSFILVTGTPQARYRVGGTVTASLFRPAHAFDRLLRPQQWRRQDLRMLFRAMSEGKETPHFVNVQTGPAAK